MIKELNRIIFDSSCYACNRTLSIQERHICYYCLAQIEETGFHHFPQNNELYFRFAGKFPLEGASSLYFYDKAGRFQKIIQALKYKESPQIGSYLGMNYAESLLESSFLDGIREIVPVPLHWTKRARRGYNQAEQIAKGISKISGIPYSIRSLIRKRRTQTQAKKKGDARWRNVSGAFVVKRDLPDSVLLVDDVVTTGSTLEACAKALINASPNIKIKIASLGMARRS
ncbi:MAG: ComF family protein [Bacteroidia bacterium]|nr:ComF family protein [Bacteroidia bacterium]